MPSSSRPQSATMNLDVEAGATLATAPQVESADALESAKTVRHFSPRQELGGLGRQLVEFVEPLLAEGDGSPEHEQNILELGRACWQMALQTPDERAERIRQVEQALCETDEDREALRTLVQSMIERHRALFPWLHGR